MAKQNLGRLQREAADKETAEKEAADLYTFIDASGNAIFSVPGWKTVTGRRYVEVQSFLVAFDREQRAATPLSREYALMPDGSEKEEFVQRHFAEMEAETTALIPLTRSKIYQQFRLSIDQSGLTEAQRTMIASDIDSDFWLDQDLEAMRAWTDRFHKRVGIGSKGN